MHSKMLSLASAAVLACISSPVLAYRARDLQGVLGAKADDELAYCDEVAPDSYPGFCDPDVSEKACYHKSKAIGEVDVHWQCSTPEDPDAITQESCDGRGWKYTGPSNKPDLTKKGKHPNVFFNQDNFYQGACKFRRSKVSQPSDEEAQKLQDKELKISAASAKKGEEHEVQAAVGAKTDNDLPDCLEVAPDSFPGLCDPTVSKKACYHKSKAIGKIDVHWQCSNPNDLDAITQESCDGRPWTYMGPSNEETTTKKGKQEMVFFKQDNFYQGACKFSQVEPVKFQAEEAASSSTVTTSTKMKAEAKKDETSSITTTEAEATTSTVTTTKSGGARLSVPFVAIGLVVLLALTSAFM